MRKDYAKRSIRSKRSLEQGWFKRLLFIIFFAALLGLPAYCFYYYKTYSFQSLEEWVAIIKKTFHPIKPAPKNELVKENPMEDSDIHFDFYTELSAAPHITPIKSKNTNRNQLEVISVQQKTASSMYIVQLGLFKNESEANKLRLSMLLEGVESQIIKTSTGYYRLQQGPYLNLAHAEEVQNKLKNKGIVSLIHHVEPSANQSQGL